VQAADRRGARTIKREERREKKRVTRKNDGTRLGEGERERERERERGKEGKREGEGERERERERTGDGRRNARAWSQSPRADPAKLFKFKFEISSGVANILFVSFGPRR